MIKLICGRSRAGKTTYTKPYPKAFHLDYGGYDRMIIKTMQAEDNVVIEGIYDTAERRKALLEAYKGEGKRICIWLDTPLDVIESRFGRWKPHNLPHPFEPPTLEEGWDEIIVITGDNNVECSYRQKQD